MIAYLTCLLAIIGWIRQLRAGRTAALPVADARESSLVAFAEPREGSRELLTFCYVLTSAAAVAMGNRFFRGYFLLWLPFVAVAFGQGLDFLTHYATKRWGNPWTVGFAARSLVALHNPLLPLQTCILLALTFVVMLGDERRDKQPGWLTCWARLVLIAMLLLVGCTDYLSSLAKPRRLGVVCWHVPSVITRMFFGQHARLGDRLFVWGSRPEFYVATGLEPATRDTTCGFAEGQFFEVDGIPAGWAGQLFEQLEQRTPRFIVVGPAASTELGGSTAYGLKTFPALATYLEAHYEHCATYPIVSCMNGVDGRTRLGERDSPRRFCQSPLIIQRAPASSDAILAA